jgi:hypothetical protein
LVKDIRRFPGVEKSGSKRQKSSYKGPSVGFKNCKIYDIPLMRIIACAKIKQNWPKTKLIVDNLGTSCEN